MKRLQKRNEIWCEAPPSDAEGRGSLREDPGRGLGFGIFHSNSALLFNDVLTAGGKWCEALSSVSWLSGGPSG